MPLSALEILGLLVAGITATGALFEYLDSRDRDRWYRDTSDSPEGTEFREWFDRNVSPIRARRPL